MRVRYMLLLHSDPMRIATSIENCACDVQFIGLLWECAIRQYHTPSHKCGSVMDGKMCIDNRKHSHYIADEICAEFVY